MSDDTRRRLEDAGPPRHARCPTPPLPTPSRRGLLRRSARACPPAGAPAAARRRPGRALARPRRGGRRRWPSSRSSLPWPARSRRASPWPRRSSRRRSTSRSRSPTARSSRIPTASSCPRARSCRWGRAATPASARRSWVPATSPRSGRAGCEIEHASPVARRAVALARDADARAPGATPRDATPRDPSRSRSAATHAARRTPSRPDAARPRPDARARRRRRRRRRHRVPPRPSRPPARHATPTPGALVRRPRLRARLVDGPRIAVRWTRDATGRARYVLIVDGLARTGPRAGSRLSRARGSSASSRRRPSARCGTAYRSG